jgi:hypothetical protein
LFKYILFINILMLNLLANFNPFFVEEKKKVEVEPKKEIEKQVIKPKVIIKKVPIKVKKKEKPKPKQLDADYIGYISYNGNNLAIITIGDKKFIVKRKDKLYVKDTIIHILSIDERVIKIKNDKSIQYISFSYKSK